MTSCLFACTVNSSGLVSTRQTRTCTGYWSGFPPVWIRDFGGYYKYNNYNINWSDGASEQSEIGGSGECVETPAANCPPFFYQPYYHTANTYAKFVVTIDHKRVINGCENDFTQTKYVNHNCSGTAGGCGGSADYVQYPTTGCASGFLNMGGSCDRSIAFQSNCGQFGGYDPDACGCYGGCEEGGSCSPIVVDVLGNGFDLTSTLNGINFDIDNDGTLEHHAWTSANNDDAWLAFDRNNNGLIDTGRELFGNVTPQEPPPAGEEMNGFRALAMYDGSGYGGNGDGKINQQDAIFDRLKLWQDTNHNGISESCELFTLPDLGLRKIDLDYRQSRRVDQYGNQFKYRARVRDAEDAQLGRWAWDVFLVVEH